VKKLIFSDYRKETEQVSNLKLVRSDTANVIGELYMRHFSELLFIAYRLVANEEEAEDVVSGIFEKLITKNSAMWNFQTGESETELIGYLKISVRNACYDILRSRKRKHGILFRLGNTLQFWKTPEIYSKFQKEAFEMMMTELSLREKEIFELHLEGYKNSEIAERLKLSELTVRNTLHNAKKRIRKMWNTFMR
jgi:RNA polymerase sigma-70 factor (ECF subfamily)